MLTAPSLRRCLSIHVGRLPNDALLAGVLLALALQCGLPRPAGAAIGRATNLPQVVTTGSIAAESNQLTVSSASGFNVGDWVIVEIGKEAGQGQRGTRGVGGTWPSKSYPTEAQLLADKSQPNRQFAWAEDTGYVFWWLDGQWFNLAPNRPNTFYTGSVLSRQSHPTFAAGTHHGDQRQHAHAG